MFGIYPYICLAVFFYWRLMRSLTTSRVRPGRATLGSCSRRGSLRWGSNLFHIGVLFLFFGHTVGMLTPHFMYEAFISAGDKQLMAIV